MATHDYVIANGTGASVRSDLNNALAAIVSNNSSATEPTTTYAYMWWADTTAGQLKLRNAADNAWVTIQELDGTMLMQDGTVGAPGLAFASDLDTGFYRPAANELGIATGGTNAVYIDDAQNVGIGTNAPQKLAVVSKAGAEGVEFEPGNATNTNRIQHYNRSSSAWVEHQNLASAHAFYIQTSEKARIDSSGNVGIGTTSPSAQLHVSGTGNNVLLESTSDAYPLGIKGTGATQTAYLGVGSSDALQFYVSGSERFRCDSSGRLLVGTTSQNGRLTINGETADTTANSLSVRDSAALALFTVRNDGRILAAGAGSPYNKTTGTAANAVFGSDGVFYRSTSSLKYKTNIKDTSHGLEELLALRPVTYEGTSEVDAGITFGGLIAEEVHDAGLTEFVQYAKDGSPDALAYGPMVSLCIKAIQEQQSLIADLQAEVAALKAQ